ncbi:MAG: metal ABC transporter substrate-binding protein [Synechococcaceae cyanobacterium]|nr:metal ABC transporter substrate-binding protein [Synechococcaceae cyanobacterium]
MGSRLAVAPALLALAAALPGCGTPGAGTPPSGAAAAVVAADGVLCDLVQRLTAGDRPVACLLQAGEDPHAFRLTPQQRRGLSSASLLLINGYGLSPALSRLPQAVPVAERAVPDSPRLDGGATDGEGHPPDDDHGHGHGHEHGHAGERDPHVWHDPLQARAMLTFVAEQLARQQPATAGMVRQRASRLAGLLQELDRWNGQQLATVPRRDGGRLPPLATAHRSAASFARRYGLRELSLLDALSRSASLRPQSLEQVVDELRRSRVPMLFREPGDPSHTLQRLSRLSGAPLSPEPLVVDGLGRGPQGSLSLMATLVSNTCRISTGLGGRCDREGGESLIRRWQQDPVTADGDRGAAASGRQP